MLGVLAAGVIAAGVMLWQNVDIQRLTRSSALREAPAIPAALPPATPAAVRRRYPAAIFVSERSRRFFPDSEYYPNLVHQWEELVAETGGRPSRVTSAAQLADLDGKGVVVAPAPVCLGVDEAAALRAHAEHGGGLVLSWAAGARDSTCEWAGWEPVARLIGSEEARELGSRKAVFLAIPAGTPLSAGFDPGTRVELRYESQVAVATVGPRVYWSDWALNAAPAADTRELNAATMTAWTDGGGRIVWFGYRLGQGARPQDNERLSGLAANGIRWAAELPVAQIAVWPAGARAALVVSQDVESKFTNALALADIAKRKHAPVTFFAVSQMALDYPEIADSLVAAGEVGSQTSDHALVAGQSYSDQRSRLGRSWDEIHNWTGAAVPGLHPPEERFDENTLRAWRDAGGSYLLAVNESRSAVPEAFDTPAGPIVLLPRIVKDDYNVFVQESALRSVRLAEAYLQGMAKVRAIGGLAIVSTRTQVGGEPGRIRVVGEIIDSARTTGDWWIAAGSDVAEWWLQRRESRVEFSTVSDTLLQVRVTGPAGGTLREAWLTIDLPGYPEDWTPYVEDRSIEYLIAEWGLRIPLEDVAANTTTMVTLRRSDRPR